MIDSEIVSPKKSAGRSALLQQSLGVAARVGGHEPRARPEHQAVPRRSERNLQFRPDLQFAERDSLAVKEFILVVAFQ